MSRRLTSGASAAEGSIRNGLVPARACDECRKRKMKCDGSRPCRSCTNKEISCEYNEGDRRRTNGESLAVIRDRLIEMDGLKSRMERVERLVTMLAEKSGIPVDADPAGPPQQRLSHIQTSETEEPPGDEQPNEEFGRLQRAGDQDTLVQIGPTSLWSYKRSAPSASSPLQSLGDLSMPGDYEDWSRNLPVCLNIDRTVHDRALAFFGAYYAPWCYLVDTPRFYRDMRRCTLVRPSDPNHVAPNRTSYYSPLLHSTALYMGIFINRGEWPNLMRAYNSVFMEHTAQQLLKECDQSSLSSVRAYNLYAQAIHNLRLATNESRVGERHTATGYIYSGLAISGAYQLGLNVNADAYVDRGEMSQEERQARDYTYWTIFLQDMSRAFASGRPPMLADSNNPLPVMDPNIDDIAWLPPAGLPMSPGFQSCAGQQGQYTKTHRCAAELTSIGRLIMDTIYFGKRGSRNNRNVLNDLSSQLDRWYTDLPLKPVEASPLPHVIQLHMTHQLLVIYLHRPFYQKGVQTDVKKCNDAACQILHLSGLFQRHHGLHLAHHSAITVMFCAATIFLLQSANGDDSSNARAHFRECTEYLGQVGMTWHEALSSKQILLSLQSEYFPAASFSDTTAGPTMPIAPVAALHPSDMPGPSTAQTTINGQNPDMVWSQGDLSQWLAEQGLWTFANDNNNMMTMGDPGAITESLQDLFPL